MHDNKSVKRGSKTKTETVMASALRGVIPFAATRRVENHNGFLLFSVRSRIGTANRAEISRNQKRPSPVLPRALDQTVYEVLVNYVNQSGEKVDMGKKNRLLMACVK